jgi:methyltransferase (TIGR00027 family)
MRTGRPSLTAQYVNLARAYAAREGLLDDNYSERFVVGWLRQAFALTRFVPLGRRGFGFILGRTKFFDDLVRTAIDDGVRQVVIIAAGFDSRAWRLASDQVRFIEIDHPDTQVMKRKLAPSAHAPTYIAADLATETIESALERSPHNPDERAVVLCEGVTMYLTREQNESLLRGIARSSGTGTILGTGFAEEAPATPSTGARFASRASRALPAVGGEPITFALAHDEIAPFLKQNGWIATDLVTASEVFDRYVAPTQLPRPPDVPGSTNLSAIIAPR